MKRRNCQGDSIWYCCSTRLSYEWAGWVTSLSHEDIGQTPRSYCSNCFGKGSSCLSTYVFLPMNQDLLKVVSSLWSLIGNHLFMPSLISVFFEHLIVYISQFCTYVAYILSLFPGCKSHHSNKITSSLKAIPCYYF